MSVRLKRVPEPPAQNCSGLHDPAGQGGAGPHSACLSGQCVQISKKEGCGAAAPLTAPPPPKKTRQQKQGWRQRQYCFSHHAWREWASGREEEGWIKGVS